MKLKSATIKKTLYWIIGILIVLIALITVGIFSIDPVAKSIAEKRLSEETGMEAHIGKFNLGLRSQSVHIADLKLINPPEFGGSTFVHIPELFVQFDAEAIQENKLRIRTLRIDVAELHVVEKEDGTKNIDVFQKKPSTEPVPQTPKKSSTEKIEFAGIDQLSLSLGNIKFTSERHSNRNYERNLGVRNRIFNDIKSEKDLKTAGVLIAAQIGMNALLEGSSPGDLLNGGAVSGKETKKLFEELFDAFK